MRFSTLSCSILVALIFIFAICRAVAAQALTSTEGAPAVLSSDTAAIPQSTPQIIVVGFVGGFVHGDNTFHSAVQVASRIRRDYPSGVYVNTFENHRGEDAHRFILQALDSNHDGRLSGDEKHNARIVLYGHSWGGSETVTLANQLNVDGIPVLLTIQVDSITKRGENDGVIPSNVAQAVNYYQTNGLVHGRTTIRAEDPMRTQVIGNFRFDYAGSPPVCELGYPWWDRMFMKPHIAIECDPDVWRQVEALIRAKLPKPLLPESTSMKQN
ncbi:MAG: hypothetical protein WCA38_17900 [Candidatus Acidiferrales bacterium]